MFKRQLFQSFSLTWAAASLAGAGAGCALGWLLQGLILRLQDAPGDPTLLSLMVVLPLMGLGMGLGQAWAMRGAVPGAGWWAVSGFFGWLFGISVDMIFRRAMAMPPWTTFLVVGVYLGALQWLVMFRRLPFAAVLIVLNPPVWVLLYVILAQVGGLAGAAAQSQLLSIAGWAGIGGLYGLLSGPVMHWLLRARPAPQGSP